MVIPVKSPNDKKEYRILNLNNGLKALLISEPADENAIDGDSSSSEKDPMSESESDEEMASVTSSDDDDDDEESSKKEAMNEKLAAAALCVGIGSFSDPDLVGGLAHYLEHMVFMGSEKYPDENKFDSFVQLHGGSTNACTDCERTIFQFDVTQKYFKESLDIFAQFFIAPLLKKDSMDRELNAVESEYQMNLPTDYFRTQHLFSLLAQENHPMRKFMWGNTLSLKTIPEKENIDIYENLQNFRKKYYSSHFMTLVVQARETLDTLQEWTQDIFSDIPNNNSKLPTFNHLKNGFETPQFNKMYKVVPVKNTHQLVLSWALPSMVANYNEKPLEYLGWLVGHEGKGSILSYLRKKVWALFMSGGNDGDGFDDNSTCSLFKVSVTLTEEGLDHLFEVITIILEYLEMLRISGASDRIYKEIQTIEENNFLWQEEIQPIDNVEQLSEDMQLYPEKDYLTGRTLLKNYDSKLIEKCQNLLTHDRMNVTVLSLRYKSECENMLTEKWSQAPYQELDIDEEWKKSWHDLKPRSELYLPGPNKYIATNFTLTPTSKSDSELPVCVVKNDYNKLWFKRDSKFNIPKAHINYILKSPVFSSSVENAVMTNLFICILDLNLKEECYDAEVAQLECDLSCMENEIIIKTYGFNEKLLALFFTVIDSIKNFQVTDELFESMKKQMIKNFYNYYSKPKKLCNEIRLSVLQNLFWASYEKRSAVASITNKQLMEFVNNFKSNLHIEGLIQGNISLENAINIHQKLCHELDIERNFANSVKGVTVLTLPEENKICRVLNFNDNDGNSVITNYYQFGQCKVIDVAMIDLAIAFMEEPCFDKLRTKEQLSYHVSCSSRDTFGISGFTILVCPQADKFSCLHVDERIEGFLDEFVTQMMGISEEEFQDQIQSLIKLKQCEDLRLEKEVDRNWSEISSYYYLFDRRIKEIEYLKSFTSKDFKSWCQDNLSRSGALRKRKLSVQVIGKGSQEEETEIKIDKDSESHSLVHLPVPSSLNYQQLIDIRQAKQKMEFYPESKILL